MYIILFKIQIMISRNIYMRYIINPIFINFFHFYYINIFFKINFFFKLSNKKNAKRGIVSIYNYYSIHIVAIITLFMTKHRERKR